MKKMIKIALIAIIVIFTLTVGVKAAFSIAASQVTYSDTTVQAMLDYLVKRTNNIKKEQFKCLPGMHVTPGYYCETSTTCPSGALCEKVNIGDYVSMTPTSTSYTIPGSALGETYDRTINPSELNLWRVIDIRDDGTIEMVSAYVSSTIVYFTGKIGYMNLVGTLNVIAKQYENSKYTVGSRHIGFNGQTQVITDTSPFENPSLLLNTSTFDNSSDSVGGGDVMYTYDTNTSTGLVYKALNTLRASKVGTTTATEYWLGSRHYNYTGSTNYDWRGRYVGNTGSVYNNRLYYYDSRLGLRNESYGYAIRPIVTLKSDIQATGSGTSGDPWILS